MEHKYGTQKHLSNSHCCYFNCEITVSRPLSSTSAQHTVTGSYGEVRDHFDSGAERDHIHNGIDIYKSGSNHPVYPVVTGTVDQISTIQYKETVVVLGDDGYYYSYMHLGTILVEDEEDVTASVSIIGTINTDVNHTHLHFCDGDVLGNGASDNPLIWLEPFDDVSTPTIESIHVAKNISLDATSYTDLSSITFGDAVDIVVKTHDDIPTYGGTNIGIYQIEIEIKDENDGVVTTFNAIKFEQRFSSSDWTAKHVYAPGSTGSPLDYYYIATNGLNYDDSWDTSFESEGQYTMKARVWSIEGADYVRT